MLFLTNRNVHLKVPGSCKQFSLCETSAAVWLTGRLARPVLCTLAYVASEVNEGLILVLCSSLWTLSWLMNAEQRGGMALNKDFRSKTGNGSASREGRTIATPTGELLRQHPSLLPSIFIYFFIALLLIPSFSGGFVPILLFYFLSVILSFFSSFFMVSWLPDLSEREL